MTARLRDVLRLAAIVVLAAGVSSRPMIAQDRQVERAYHDLVRSVVRIEVRYASIFEPPGAGSGRRRSGIGSRQAPDGANGVHVGASRTLLTPAFGAPENRQ